MKILVMLTSTFPFDKGEDFLSEEINYVNGFDRVLVCPYNLKADSTKTKQIPKNVECIPLKRKNLSKSAYLKLLCKPSVLSEINMLLYNGSFSFARVHELLFFMKHAYEIYNSLKQISVLFKAEEVCIYSYWFYDAAVAAALLKRNLQKCNIKVKQISRAHGFDIHEERSKLNYLPMRNFLLNNVNYLYPCSQNGVDTFISKYPKYKEKIKPAFLGTADHGTKYGNRKNGIHIVSCSYMVPVKRLHLIVEALKLVHFPILWTHIGSGPLMDEIRNSTLNLPHCVKVEFKGQMNNEDIMKFYKDSDVTVFINVSSSEGLPVSIMEADSFGIPVIATNAGGTGEAVYDGENGYLLDVNMSSKDLLLKLNYINQLSEEKYNKLCENSRKIWAEKFNAVDNYKKFYKEISQ